MLCLDAATLFFSLPSLLPLLASMFLSIILKRISMGDIGDMFICASIHVLYMHDEMLYALLGEVT